MILIDERVGSRELLQAIRNYGADAEIAGRLSGDFEFVGNGPNDEPLLVGYERKTISDLCDSMRSNRLAGQQAIGMIDTYDRRWIIIEGIWRRHQDGLVEAMFGHQWRIVHGQVRYSEIIRFLNSMSEFGGYQQWRTSNEHETASFIAEQWHWYQKPWTAHTTHKTLYNPDPSRMRVNGKPALWRRESPLVELWAGKLKGIDSRAEIVAKFFKSARFMANAPACLWEQIPGIGRKRADQIVESITKEIE